MKTTFTLQVETQRDAGWVRLALCDVDLLRKHHPLIQDVQPLEDRWDDATRLWGRSYRITDVIRIFGLSQAIQYTASCLAGSRWVEWTSRAPLGVVLRTRYDIYTCRVVETTQVEAPWYALWFVARQAKAAHAALLTGLARVQVHPSSP